MPFSGPIPAYGPPTLFDDVHPDNGSWSAFQVRARSEKLVSQRLLTRASLGYFLPFTEQIRRYQRRRVTVQTLLFPGYVFAFGKPESARQCRFSLPGVVNHLEESDQASLHDSLVKLKGMIESGAPVTPEERLEPGMAVEITHGPLAGYRGHVIENKLGLRFIVQLNFIRQGASVAVEGSMVKAL